MRILIIDDSKSVQKLVSWRLKNRGYEIVGTGSDGNEGVELFKEMLPDLMLLDITMPNKDGRECLKEVLTINPKAKVVMLSALGSPDMIEECLKIGAIAFIDKNKMMIKDHLESQVEEILKNIQKLAA